jgi:hypothetical protein
LRQLRCQDLVGFYIFPIDKEAGCTGIHQSTDTILLLVVCAFDFYPKVEGTRTNFGSADIEFSGTGDTSVVAEESFSISSTASTSKQFLQGSGGVSFTCRLLENPDRGLPFPERLLVLRKPARVRVGLSCPSKHLVAPSIHLPLPYSCS